MRSTAAGAEMTISSGIFPKKFVKLTAILAPTQHVVAQNMFFPLFDIEPEVLMADDPRIGCDIQRPVARSVETQQTVMLHTTLLCIDETDRVFEFSFGIVVISDDDTMETFETQDPLMSRPYLPDEIRSKVMDLVLLDLVYMVRRFRPQHIIRVRKINNGPPKTDGKHNLISEVLTGMDYPVEETFVDKLGRKTWYHTLHSDDEA
ncbi:hypothetical protein D3874_15775 [Oleomonas cavernae]|uniref:Uncharacterized protein n=2 Tax=Oleomonas cavernae TaxID=2320859 RepID=A0A418WE50_9PROT|nr:hypothetical protein D3874_15775 [Oleomonas cavernae]